MTKSPFPYDTSSMTPDPQYEANDTGREDYPAEVYVKASVAREGVRHLRMPRGIARCGADYPCMMATDVLERVTCDWCKQAVAQSDVIEMHPPPVAQDAPLPISMAHDLASEWVRAAARGDEDGELLALTNLRRLVENVRGTACVPIAQEVAAREEEERDD